MIKGQERISTQITKKLNTKEANLIPVSMKIIGLSKFEIGHTEFNSSHIVISITDDDEYFPDNSEKNCLGVLKLAVRDAEITPFESITLPHVSTISKGESA